MLSALGALTGPATFGKEKGTRCGQAEMERNFIQEREKDGCSDLLKEQEFYLWVEKLLDQAPGHLQKETQTTWQVWQSLGANPDMP